MSRSDAVELETPKTNEIRDGVGPPSLSAVEEAARIHDRMLVTGALLLVSALGSMEMTVTSTVMPTIIGELNGVEHYSWVASMYLLAQSVGMPFYGRLSDAVGRKRVLIGSICLFMLASVLASMAHSMTQLIVFRALQGLGAGGILPVANTILGDIYTLRERAKIQAVFSAVWGTGALAGPVLGALLVKTLGWRSAFYVNLPLGAISMIGLLWRYRDREKPHSTDLDLPGLGYLTVAASALLFLASGVGPGGWIGNGALLATTILATILLVRHERRAANPVLPPEFITNRSIGPSLLGGALFGVTMLGVDTYVPLYVQGALGGGVGAAAWVVTPVMLMWAVSSFCAGWFVVHWGFRKTALIGGACVSTGMAGVLACALLKAPIIFVTASLALTGAGFGPSSLTFMLAAQGAVTWQKRGIVTSSVIFFRLVGGAVGIGLLGAIFTFFLQPHLPALEKMGVSPSQLLDPRGAGYGRPLPRAALELGRSVIARGSIWIFTGMLVFGALQTAMAAFMQGRKSEHKISSAEVMESIG